MVCLLFLADEVLNTELPFVKTRPLKNAIPKSRMIAQDHVITPAARPKTCVSLARRLVSGHLGMKINVTDKQREAEKKLLSDARGWYNVGILIWKTAVPQAMSPYFNKPNSYVQNIM